MQRLWQIFFCQGYLKFLILTTFMRLIVAKRYVLVLLKSNWSSHFYIDELHGYQLFDVNARGENAMTPFLHRS